MKSQKAKVYLKGDIWVAQTEDGREHYIVDQKPCHARLDIARDNGRMALVEVLEGSGVWGGGSVAEFKDFVR